MKKYIITHIIFLLVAIITINGQDIHFSQYAHTPLWVNPTAAGQTDGDVRLTASYRSQWASVTVPYRTMIGALDMKLPWYFGDGCSYFAVGGMLMNDVAGDANFRTSSAQLAISYHQAISKRRRPSYMSVGIMGGAGQMGLRRFELYFDNQFNGSTFDTGIQHGEEFDRTYFGFVDLSAGLAFTFPIGKESGLYMGFGMYHLNQPNISLMGNSDESLYARYTGHISGDIVLPWDVPLSFQPSLVVMGQGPFRETIIGLNTKYTMSKALSMTLGVMYRTGDAFIPMLRFDMSTVAFAFSYDLNTSELAVASSSQGGMEFSLMFSPKVFRKERACATVYCPWGK